LATHTNHTEHSEVYFCTVTCYKWLPLFEEAQAYDSVYRWFSHLKDDQCLLTAFVIMPNHFHVLLFPMHAGVSLNKIIGDGKRFMAYDIVQKLRFLNKSSLLEILQKGVQQHEKQKRKIHQVFKHSFDAKKCFSEKMLEQKLEYIHHNPVKGKWSLVSDFVNYPNSSAAFYEGGMLNPAPLVHYKNLGIEKEQFFKTSESSGE
jgi:REP element-mobilizing transposase RayT